MGNKRKSNTIGLKVKFLPCTDTKPSRLRFTQTNVNKSCITSTSNKFETLDYINWLLESIKGINSYSLVIDNTQNDYYFFSIDTDNEIPNLIKSIKELSQ